MSKYLKPIVKLVVFLIFLIICSFPVWVFQLIPVLKSLKDPYSTAVIEMLFIASIFGALWLISRVYKPSAFENFYLLKKDLLKGILKGGAVGVGCMVVCVTLIILFGLVSFSISKISIALFLFYILFFLVVAVFEELLFRTYPLFVFAETYPIWLAVLINGLLFGLIHISNPNFTWLAMLNISLAGILLSMFTLYHKSINWAIGIHFGWNFSQGILFGYKVSGTDTPAVLVAKPKGTYYFSGGEFGIEGSLICTLVLTLVIIYLVLKYKLEQKKEFIVENEFN